MIAELQNACAAFLLAVLVTDLTFDLPNLRARDTASAAQTLDAATRYYARVTTRKSPLATAVALAMTVLVATIGHDFVALERPLRQVAIEASLAVGPIALAIFRTFPSARRLAAGEGDAKSRTARACTIAVDHLVALVGMGAYLAVQIARSNQ